MMLGAILLAGALAAAAWLADVRRGGAKPAAIPAKVPVRGGARPQERR